MTVKLEIEMVLMNIVCGYVPQVGCVMEEEEEEKFWTV